MPGFQIVPEKCTELAAYIAYRYDVAADLRCMARATIATPIAKRRVLEGSGIAGADWETMTRESEPPEFSG